MNNEFFDALTWAYLLYVVIPMAGVGAYMAISDKIDERRHHAELDERAKEEDRWRQEMDADLERIKAIDSHHTSELEASN